MTGWLVNDRLSTIPGTRTFWNHLLDGIPGLQNRCLGQYEGLASAIEHEAEVDRPDYIVRNAAYFRWLDVKAEVVSLVQDVLYGFQRDMLVEACAASRIVVFNSEYTRSMYPELHSTDHRVIPIGTDEAIFKPSDPDPQVPEGSVLWVGSGHHVKGFDLACRLASESRRPWVFVMKDDAPVEVAALVLRRITQDQLARVSSASAVGICTSKTETQHLAGIEMGMCGVPLVTTEVGAYYRRPHGAWGRTTGGEWHEEIEFASKMDRGGASRYWNDAGFGLSECMEKWRNEVANLEVAHVDG